MTDMDGWVAFVDFGKRKILNCEDGREIPRSTRRNRLGLRLVGGPSQLHRNGDHNGKKKAGKLGMLGLAGRLGHGTTPKMKWGKSIIDHSLEQVKK